MLLQRLHNCRNNCLNSGKCLADLVEPLPKWAICMICVTFGAAFTEICSNSASVSLLLPILFDLSEQLCLHPLYITLPGKIEIFNKKYVNFCRLSKKKISTPKKVTIACCLSFMLPGLSLHMTKKLYRA